MNSAMATANDDGLDYVLVDGLVKFEPGPRDLALLIDAPSSHAGVELCRELLASSGTPLLLLGDSGINLRPFARYDQDTAVAMIGHICGECIRAEMHEQWQARRLDHARPPGHKKLGIAQTEALQAELYARRRQPGEPTFMPRHVGGRAAAGPASAALLDRQWPWPSGERPAQADLLVQCRTATHPHDLQDHPRISALTSAATAAAPYAPWRRWRHHRSPLIPH